MSTTSPQTSIWNVPLERHPHFVGRQEILLRLDQALHASNPKAHVQAICGLGGVGKTQLALEYAYRHRDQYDLVWWIRAENPAALSAGGAALATRLGAVVSADASQQFICDTVKGLLGRRDRWLLILDNVSHPNTIRQILPGGRRGHVLITSRNPNWDHLGGSTLLPPLARPESIELLRASTGRTAEQESVAAQLAQAMGDLPLALAQAAACIVSGQISFSDYLRQFETHWADLLHRQRPGDEYPDSVAMTLELSVRQVEQAVPAAVQLLSLCAFLAGDEIRLATLEDAATLLPEPLAAIVSSPPALRQAILCLAQYSLIDAGPQTLCLHPVTAAVARDRLAPPAQTEYAARAVNAVNRAFSFDSQNVQTWTPCAALIPHALAAANHAVQLHTAGDVTAELLGQVGRYLTRCGHFAEAVDALQGGLTLAQSAYGPRHPKVAGLANDLARALIRLDRRQDALQYLEMALDIDQGVYGSADPHLAAVINNYGKCLHAGGDMEMARLQFEQALGIYQIHYGSDHPKVACVTNNLGYVLLTLGNYRQALGHFQRALDIAERGCGPAHPTVASILYNLASVQWAMGNHPAARAYLERALAIDQQAYGPNHPDVARDINKMGHLLQDLGELQAARSHFQRALDILKQAYGQQHPRTSTLQKSMQTAQMVQSSRVDQPTHGEPSAT